MSLMSLIAALPKTELHLHIEGSLEPELMMALATKHNVSLPYTTVEEVAAAYQFDSLQSFLDLYYLGASVLRDEEDFYCLMRDYLQRSHAQGVVHCEIMFDPQTHTERGIGYDVFMPGFCRAIEEAKQNGGPSVLLILSFLRHLTEQEAIQTLQDAKPYLDRITAVGLDSSEKGNPPEKFARVFEQAGQHGLLKVAHAGEEGPASYIWSALNTLQVDRIDHGVRCLEDPELVEHLVQHQIPLTVCPLSNVKLCVYEKMEQHPLRDMLAKGLNVTVNADDPSYFGGYLLENYQALVTSLALTREEALTLIRNGFRASFLAPEQKQYWLDKIEQMADAHP
ncbi:adenosine deaminase [Aestuariibacter halophilus]|uniref:Adenine deaminase n=1 Tax=Fluctibacter halophilus TaxID=226011 RepID=A0ABS8G5C3_9ALTE|nr:adenosine deaminase [Aestuariibacter halophilus]MCC2615730.1 adenosine deaminase [Aestuariibacter halophilus]